MVFRYQEQSQETILLSSETPVHKPPVRVSIYGIQRQKQKSGKKLSQNRKKKVNRYIQCLIWGEK